ATPPIQNALVKTPFFHLIFPAKTTIAHSIHDQLIKKNYQIRDVGLNSPNKIITVNVVGTAAYFNIVKGSIEQEVNTFLQSANSEQYSLEIVHELPHSSDSTAKKQRTENVTKLEKAIMNDARLQDFEIISAFANINDVENFIPLVLSDQEKRIGDIIQVVNTIVSEQDMGQFTIKPLYIDVENEKIAKKWQPIINSIHAGLIINMEYEILDVYYSFDKPLTLSITTSLNSTDSQDAKTALKIEQSINDFLLSEEISKIIQNESYKIHIYSEDNTLIDVSSPQLSDFSWQ
ncbi:MAG: DUF4030 domain-containing protein, partial [Lysinibacillus sp.]